MNKRMKGMAYEEVAVTYLLRSGYEILERNFYAKHGELDVIAKKDGYLCFIEVKYRRSLSYGYAAEAVSATKQRAMFLSAREYLFQKRIPANTPIRFDVVAIQGTQIMLYENAFEVG